MDLKKHGKILFNGLVVVTPLIITVYVVVTSVRWLDNAMQKALEHLFNVRAPVLGPGLGFVAALLGIYVVGLLARSWLLKWPMSIAESAMQQIPLIKSLYSALKDLLHFVGGPDAKSRGKPCVVQLGDDGPQALGLITSETPRRFLPDDPVDRVAVFMPMSYQLGGPTLYVPADKVRVIEGMSVEELLKLCLTAGVSAPTEKGGGELAPDAASSEQRPPAEASAKAGATSNVPSEHEHEHEQENDQEH